MRIEQCTKNKIPVDLDGRRYWIRGVRIYTSPAKKEEKQIVNVRLVMPFFWRIQLYLIALRHLWYRIRGGGGGKI